MLSPEAHSYPRMIWPCKVCAGAPTRSRYDIFVLLAWVAIPINCGMIALATEQLDAYFDPVDFTGHIRYYF